MIVFGIDPGFASCGWATVQLLPEGRERVVDAGVVRTEKSAKKRAVLASDDNHRRSVELFGALWRLVASQRVVAIAAESQSWPRNAGASAKVGMAWGVISAIAARLELPLVQASPQAVKRAICGRKDASKEDVLAALEQRYGVEQLEPILALPKTQQEHPSDALAAAVACLDSEIVRMARQLMPERIGCADVVVRELPPDVAEMWGASSVVEFPAGTKIRGVS